MKNERVMRQLEDLLHEERHNLISGDLGRLAPLARRKEAMLTALDALELPAGALARLAALSAHNQSLLLAAQNGLQSALARLADVQRGAPVGTYSRSGEKSEYSKPVRTLQRRA